jgi:oxygen-independent coproporphyrinogen-3 oxidase
MIKISDQKIPLSLYIHIPWCIKKCPYCDFNSYAAPTKIPETEYAEALILDFKNNLKKINNRKLHSIFIGGGTPTLLSSQIITKLLTKIASLITFKKNIEITIEANPGTINKTKLRELYRAGINRLSIGVQSLQNEKLKLLGRIHNQSEAINAIKTAQAAGFSNINIDLIYGLPQQTIQDAMYDLQTALSLNPTHLSWYQLTIEPNTIFYKKHPKLPDENMIYNIEQQGQEFIKQKGFNQYEISAYSRGEVFSPTKFQCQHNLNYWQFGDYISIGAGSHSKITHNNKIIRINKHKNPKIYMDSRLRGNDCRGEIFSPTGERTSPLPQKDLILEFMINALRLNQPITNKFFTARTGLSLDIIKDSLNEAQEQGLLNKNIAPTKQGRKFLNELLTIFVT